MTDDPETPPPAVPTEEEQQAAFRQHMAFNVEAVRGGLFASAVDIAETMKAQNVPHADAILATAAVEFAAQLWTQIMLRAGHTPKKTRESLEKQVRFFHRKHLQSEASPEATKQ